MNDFQASFGELKQFGSPNILYLVVINWRAEDFWLVINVFILHLAQKMEVAVSNLLFCSGGGGFIFLVVVAQHKGVPGMLSVILLQTKE